VTILEVPVPKRIPEGLIEELAKKSVYCSVHLKDLVVVNGGSMLRLAVDDPSHGPDVQEKVLRFIASMIRGYRKFDKKTVFQSGAEVSYTGDVWEQIQKLGWVYDSGFGQVTLCGPALALYRFFQNEFAGMATSVFAAKACQFPALIPAETLARCNYFSSFPQAVTFVSHLGEDFDMLEEFSQANKDPNAASVVFPRREALREPSYCLTPVVCYHCYRMLERQKLEPGETRTFTAENACFRYESRNTTSLERLWNFNMREIIFIGTQQSVKLHRQKCMDAVAEWIGTLGLRVSFETASDPFFTTDFSEKTYFQLLSDLKYEMRLKISEDRSIAAGSFNLHNDFFGKTFHIGSGEQTAFTACVGFGLERWVYGFLCQKGLDASKWPERVRAFLDVA
jgi:seryl-tRNA synthetase